MNLNTYFQISVSVFSTLASLLIIAILVFAIILKIRISQLLQKLSQIADSANTISVDVKDFTKRTIAAVEQFRDSIFTFEFIQKIIVTVIDLIRGNRTSKRK